jgi:hypothetical protein
MDELTKIALVGTSKYGGSLPEPDHPAAALVTGLADDAARGRLTTWRGVGPSRASSRSLRPRPRRTGRRLAGCQGYCRRSSGPVAANW